MARVKTIYPADMVAHLWANRHNVAVKTPTGNLYTSGNALYSYGSHFVIAAFLDEPATGGESLILWNDSSTTSTTNKHRSIAFRALNPYQRQRFIRCDGGLTRDNIEPRYLPGVAESNQKYAVSQLEKALTARGRRDSYIGEAVRSFAGAVAILKYTGDAKGAAKVPAIPENATNAQLADIVRSVKKAELTKKALELLQSLKKQHAYAVEKVASFDFWTAKNKPLKDDYKPCESIAKASKQTSGLIVQTSNAYKLAGLNLSSFIPKIKKENDKLFARFEPLANAENARINCKAALHRANMHALQIATFKHNEKHSKTVKAPGGHYYGRVATRADFINRGFYDAVSVSPEACALAWTNAKECAENMEFINRIFKRANNILCHQKLRDNRESFAAWKESAIEFIQGKINKPPYTMRGFDYAGSFESMPYFMGKIQAIKNELDSLNLAINARMAEIHAETIQKWRMGENVTVPRDVPIMARIKGDTVQTSWGAVVPLDHAARLVRIAQRVAARGGLTYTQGTGPRVGHFTVNHIGADLGAVIGCHSFSPDESHRIIPLIINAAKLAGIPETTE